MGTILDKNKAADWNADVIVPDPLEPVKAATQPGAPRPSLQELLSRGWSLLRGTSYHGRLFVNPASPGANLAAPEKDSGNDPEALVVYPRDVASPRSLRYGNLDLRVVNGAAVTRITAAGIYGANWAHDATIVALAGADGIVNLTQYGLAWTGIAAIGSLGNPGRLQNLKNEIRPLNTVKHHGTIVTTGGGNIDLSKTDGGGGWDAFVSVGAGTLTITFPTAFDNTNYTLTLTPQYFSGSACVLPLEVRNSRTASQAVIRFIDVVASPVANVNPASVVVGFSFTALGRMAS